MTVIGEQLKAAKRHLGWSLGLCLALCGAAAGGERYVELEMSGETFRGRVLAHNKSLCWLLDRDGSLRRIALSKVSSFKKLSSRFDPLSAVETRSALRREFRGYSIKGTGRYLVCGKSGQVERYVDLFDDVHRAFHSYFSRRGFKISRPEFPLVAIVFPDRGEFVKYCQADGVMPQPGLMGYYLRSSNRIAVFVPNASAEAKVTSAGFSEFHSAESPLQLAGTGLRDAAGQTQAVRAASSPFLALSGHALMSASNTEWHASVQAGLKDTIVHEATHQLAFNSGLHHRIGEVPQWIVEGLASLFEAPGIRQGRHGGGLRARINPERMSRFGEYLRRRQRGTLEAFVASDRKFRGATLDAYAEAWALTFFLIETRTSDYAKYLKAVSARDPLARYSAVARVADFRGAFGKDVQKLEVEFLRRMSEFVE